MTRIDLFTAPGCPGCPAAREAVFAFARSRSSVEVHEWDLSQDPGPALGRGIVGTPALLVNGTHILLGVPEPHELSGCAARPVAADPEPGGGARQKRRPPGH
jgi:glutaredoxin